MSTKLLAKLMGLWMLLTVLSLAISGRASLDILNALFTEPGLMFIAGVFTMLFGLAVVLTHNRWRSGPLALVVTLLGWLAILKGLLFASLPPALIIEAFASLNFAKFLTVYLGIAFVIGALLTYAGFKAKTEHLSA